MPDSRDRKARKRNLTPEQREKRQARRREKRHATPEVRFVLDNNTRVSVDLRAYSLNWDAARIGDPSYYVIGLAKGGSTLMHELVRALCKEAGRTYIDVPAALFDQGVEPARAVLDPDWLRSRDGSVFGGFRWLHPWMDNLALHERRKIVMVRDPRDILTSLYFSHAYSHVAPETGRLADTFDEQRTQARAQSIDDYVAGPVSLRVFRNYCHLLALTRMPDFRSYRYEDVIFEKRQWIRDLAADLDIKCPEDRLDAIADGHDRQPEAEDASNHVRQVAPGDHVRKLKPETIDLLNRRFAPVLAEFGYGTAT